MRVSRAPEKRGGGKKPLILFSMVGTTLILAAALVYFIGGFNRSSDIIAQTRKSQAPTSSATAPMVQPVAIVSTPTPQPEPTAVPEVAITMLESETETSPRTVPQVKFGEVLSQGMLELELPANRMAQTWYTFQVETSTGDITLFFAMYDDSLSNIIGTVKVDDYSQGALLDNAEVTLYYPDAPKRVLTFDGQTGMLSLAQEQDRQPYGPNLLPLDLRVALVQRDVALSDQTGDIETQLQLDLTGLSNTERIKYQRLAPEVVRDVLLQVQLLVDQIESKRIKQ